MMKKPNRSRRGPQEKKRLSYERDCVNTYGQNDKASRKAIPRFKKLSHRMLRRGARLSVERLDPSGEDDGRFDAALADATYTGRRGRTKFADCPLGFVLAWGPLPSGKDGDRVPSRNRRRNVRGIIGHLGARVDGPIGWRRRKKDKG